LAAAGMADQAHTVSMTHDFALVRHCGSLVEAGFIKSVLEAEGIDVQIPDEYAVGVNPGYTNMLGGVRVLVPADQLERASEILRTAEPEPEPSNQ
jgi:hypothetical protein